MRFPADPAWISRSRRAVTREAQEAGASGHALRIVALLTSEAVANAVVHGPSDGEVSVDVLAHDGVLRVGVHDQSTRLPVRREVQVTAHGGRGVMLIDRLSRRWGVDRDPDGKTVWFEVSL
ncbi:MULTISPECIES: ATP-binding protein [unclassified Actinotalea]|uniref:ATP-binding protein n=1 Tax=unclassified Actinotalea TaxID=2638618 RepID=UPI0015F56A7F|nr:MULTISPECIES: ATP-binding protein [unclassified Actinotalea]